MINHIWTVLCTRTITDKETNNISLFNVIEQVTVKDEPKPNGVLQLPFEICSLWVRSDPTLPEQGLVRILYSEPSGNSKQMVEYPVDLRNHERSRNVIKVSGIPISDPGRHFFRVELKIGEKDWTEVSSLPLTVLFKKETDEPSGESIVVADKSL
jgi:hypothetical protein